MTRSAVDAETPLIVATLAEPRWRGTREAKAPQHERSGATLERGEDGWLGGRVPRGAQLGESDGLVGLRRDPLLDVERTHAVEQVAAARGGREVHRMVSPERAAHPCPIASR